MREAYQVISLRVSSGKGLLLEQLEALSTRSQAEADLATAIYQRNIAFLRLARAAGVNP